MEKVTYRRTLNIGDFESISFETNGEHENLDMARLIAAQKFLYLVQQELIRIYNVKNVSVNPWDRMNLELNGITSELQQLQQLQQFQRHEK